jgi:hypothetical protein
VTQSADHRLLDEIGRVREVTRSTLEPPMCPTPQGREKPREKDVQRLPVPVTHPPEERERSGRPTGPLRVRER